MANLRSAAITGLRKFFDLHDHHPSPAIWEALEDLIDCLARMAEGTCLPVYYLSSLDPGVGKTQAVVQFLEALVSFPEYTDVGVLIGVGRLDEVRAYVEASGLSKRQYAVLTSDQDLNLMGSGRPRSSQVLFTTQQMIERRTLGRRLEEVDEFRFRGRPRAVRVWDETLEPARAITFRVDHLGNLISRYRPVAPPGFVADLERLQGDLRQIEGEALFDVPDLGSKHDLDLVSATSLSAAWPEEDRIAAVNFCLLWGCTVAVRRDGKYGASMIHYHEHLPEDLPPVVILDASGRVRETYALWKRYRGNLVRLKAAPKDYRNLKVHVWARGGGKASFENNGPELLQGIAATIDTKPNEEWLIVHHKEAGRPRRRTGLDEEGRSQFELAVKELVIKANPSKLHFINWGRHQATNAYTHVGNVVLAGTLFYTPSLYEALWRAARAYPAAKGPLQETRRRRIERGEHRHMILQAICRGAVRRSRGDTCEPCDAYVIASAGRGIPQEIERVFPGCTVLPWQPIPRKRTGKVKEAADYIELWFHENPTGALPFRQVRDAIHMTPGNFTTHVRKHLDFREFLEENHLYERGRGKYATYFTRTAFTDASAELEEEDALVLAQQDASGR